MFTDIDDHQSRVGQNHTSASLTSLVIEVIPLNRRQRILSEALAWAGRPYGSAQREQTLLYVGGEGGTGKSQIIKAIEAGMSLIGRKREVILMAPTGAAADNIGGNTYHTSPGISIDRSRVTAMSSRVRRLWSHKTIMFVDEVSMMDLTMISVIDNHCKITKSLDRSSTDLFGGLPIVIFIGDFFQFPPVRGPALWEEPRRGAGEDENGRLLWHHFKQVIILDEQMRQSEDAPFRGLLSRTRAGTLTEADRAVLNSRTITSLASPQLQDATTIVKLNSLRHQVNRIRIEQFARTRCQNVYIFPALHTRTKSTGPINLRLRADDLLQQPDQGTKIPLPGALSVHRKYACSRTDEHLYRARPGQWCYRDCCRHRDRSDAVQMRLEFEGQAYDCYKDWCRREAEAYHTTIKYLSPTVSAQVAGIGTSRELWDDLEE